MSAAVQSGARVDVVLLPMDDESARWARNAEGENPQRCVPVYYGVTGQLLTSANYAALMRDLSQRNGGSFMTLPADR
jgi:hypothetical protein